ncbi:hypothetical protein V6N13_088913 [Hibiscus sabdariffa]|uniref:CBS domain-containing protein n=1 Tax=Hibiscus sabdariffa TaxID=183260 RepID=A0ABR2G1R7_9ROSI
MRAYLSLLSLLILKVRFCSFSPVLRDVQILSQNKILSVPVVKLNAGIDRYIGIVEFAGIVVWILQQVRDISGTFQWAPFLALQKSNSFFTMMLLLSKYRMKSVPVVDLGDRKIDNIITRSAVIHMLEECTGLKAGEL